MPSAPTTTARCRHYLEYTVSPLQNWGQNVASHSLMAGACVCALFSDMNTESALLSTGLPLLALAAICGYKSTTTSSSSSGGGEDDNDNDNVEGGSTATTTTTRIGRLLYFLGVFLLPVGLCRAYAAMDYFSIVKGGFFITLAFVLPVMLLVLLATLVQKRVWLQCNRRRSSSNNNDSSRAATIRQLLAPLAFPTLLCGIFQLLFRFSPIGATGNPVMGLAVVASPPLKQAIVSVVGEIGLLAGMGLVSSLGAGQLLGQTQKIHWVLLALLWAALQIGGGWRLAAGMGLWETPIQEWPLSKAPDLHVSCLCSGQNDASMLDRINARLAAGDDLIILSETSLSQRLSPDVLQWSAENPGAVVAATFKEPVKAEEENSTNSKLYNSIELLQAGKSLLRYDKNRPVPVMEAPWVQAGKDPPTPTKIVFTPWMRSSAAAAGGGGTTWERTNVTLQVAAAICFDFDFPDVLRHARGADLVIGPSNYWSSLGRNLWSDNMFRAIESGFTLVKCARNGISGSVDPLGRILAAKPTLAGDTFSAQIPVQPGVSTIYADRGGYWFGWSCVVLSVVWVVVAFWPLNSGAGIFSSRISGYENGDMEAPISGANDDGFVEAPLLPPTEEQNSLEEPLLSIEEQEEAAQENASNPSNVDQNES